MFDFICVGAPLILNGEVVKVSKLSWIFLFSKVSLATLQIYQILVIIRLSGYPASFSGIRLSGRIVGDIRPESLIIATLQNKNILDDFILLLLHHSKLKVH